jgi:hypothetical protein
MNSAIKRWVAATALCFAFIAAAAPFAAAASAAPASAAAPAKTKKIRRKKKPPVIPVAEKPIVPVRGERLRDAGEAMGGGRTPSLGRESASLATPASAAATPPASAAASTTASAK